MAIEPVRTDLTKKHLAAADTGYVLVCDDPHMLFVIQDDGVSDTPAVTDIGEAADLIVANANTTVGRSQVMIDGSDIGTGDQVQLLEFVQREDNEIGAYAKWLVRINEHTYAAAGTII